MEKPGKAGLTPLPPYFAASSGMGCWTPGGHLASAEMDTIWASRSSHASEEGASTVHLNAGDTLGCLILQIRVPGPGSRSGNSVQEFEDSGDLFHTLLFSTPKSPILHSCPSKTSPVRLGRRVAPVTQRQQQRWPGGGQRCNGGSLEGPEMSLGCRSSKRLPKVPPKGHPIIHPAAAPAVSTYLYRNRLPLKNRLLLDTVRTWLDFSNLQQHQEWCESHTAGQALGATGSEAR